MTPIERDLSHLPRDEGLVPDADMRFADVLVQRWAAQNEAAGEKPHAIEGTRFRHSQAGKCARAIAYQAASIERSDPMDLSGVMNTSLGTLLHDAWQEALLARFGEDATRVEVKVPTVGADGSGHIDAVVEMGHASPKNPAEPYTIAIELKTIGGYGFKAAIGKARRGMVAEGPKAEHILQAALNGLAVDADEVVVVYLAKEALSKNYKVADERDRFLAEWTFTREQYEPLARAEAERVSAILGLVDEGLLARRIVPHDMPPGAEIVNPTKGTWEVHSADGDVLDTGSYWGCNYCDFQSLCAQTEAGRIPVETVVALSKKEAA